MRLDVLPLRHAGAAENMATDFLLLQRYPESKYPRFRAYGWRRPAFTFGYSQKIAFVRAQLPADETVELCRRPTGGGVVDHRNDWTYALVIPRGHPAEEARAIESYRLVHASLAEALVAHGQSAQLKERFEAAEETEPGVCFTRAELFDVIDPATSQKIAGAAQKRNKHGLLFQGSIARAAVRSDFDWESFQLSFVEHLAAALAVPTEETGWPDWSEEELSALTDQYSNSEWKEFR